MSFQDVGRTTKKRQPNRGGFGSAPSSGNRVDVVVGGTTGDNTNNATGYEQLSDLIVQYQRNVGLLEKLARSIGTPNDNSVLQTQYTLQLEVIQQLSTKIAHQLSKLSTQLSSLSRIESSTLRSTHVKLSRDYSLVESRYKSIVLDVENKRRREVVLRKKREEEEQHRMNTAATNNNNKQRGMMESGGNLEGENSELNNEEMYRRQMQIQEDRINEEIMREREEEIRNIHKGMQTVNEIYKDLATLVDNQQEGIDTIENQMEGAKENTSTGLRHIEKANESQQSQCVVS